MASKKRSRFLVAIVLIIFSLAAYGGYAVLKTVETNINNRIVTDMVKKTVKKYKKLKNNFKVSNDDSLYDNPKSIPERKRFPVLTDNGLKWGNIDDVR